MSCIALSVFDEDAIIIEMLDAGACGYLMKNSAAREVIEAIKSVYQQQPYYCRQTSVKLAGIVRHSGPASLSGEGAARFTDREKEIIRRICMEASLDAIAEEMYLSRRTIEGYRGRIMEKMRVKSTAGIVIYAIKHGIYSIQ